MFSSEILMDGSVPYWYLIMFYSVEIGGVFSHFVIPIPCHLNWFACRKTVFKTSFYAFGHNRVRVRKWERGWLQYFIQYKHTALQLKSRGRLGARKTQGTGSRRPVESNRGNADRCQTHHARTEYNLSLLFQRVLY